MARDGELSPAELELRKSGLGASDMAAISGCNPWKSALSVWLEKTGQAKPQKSGVRARLGQKMEPIIADWYREERSGLVWMKPTTMVHEEIPWAMATPDLMGAPEPGADFARRCEIKLVGRHLRKSWEQGVPPYVYVQVQWQAFVTGIEPCDVVAWFGLDEDDRQIIDVPYDAEVIEDLRDLGDRFWNWNVKREIAPPVERTDDWSQYLAERYQRSTEPPIAAPPEADALIREFIQAERAERIAEKMKEHAKNELQAMLGFHEAMIGENFKVTWKSDSKGRTDWKAVAEAMGATAEITAKHQHAPPRKFLVRTGS